MTSSLSNHAQYLTRGPEVSSEMHLCEHDICAIFASCLEPTSLRFSPRPCHGSLKFFDEAKDSICSYFVRLRASSASLKPLVDLGLNFLKNLFGTSCVEARFSTVSIVKSKQRSILSTAKLRG